MENTPTVIEQPNELVTVATESGIELSKAEQITALYVPFLLKIREAEIEMKKINFENPTKTDILLAKEIRNKMLVKNRTAAVEFKASEKAETILVNKLHDSSCNLIEAASKLTELQLFNLEKSEEIKEKAKIEATRLERVELIKPYGENYATMDLGNMDNTMFESIFNGAKLSYEAKIKADLEIENARIEREKQAAIDAETQRLEMERLKKENEIKEKQLELERIENAKIAKASKDKADAELAEQKRLADIEAKKQADIIAKQKAESDKLAAELKAKADAELKEKQRIEAENKAKELADKKAAKAPDKNKLDQWIGSFVFPNCLPLNEIESNNVHQLIIEKRNAFIEWANKQVSNL
jgi:hypothetical protein